YARTYDGDESPEEDRARPAPGEVVATGFEALRADQPRDLRVDEPSRRHASSELEADRVAERRTDGDDDDHHDHVDVPFVGQHSAEKNRAFARDEEPDE